MFFKWFFLFFAISVNANGACNALITDSEGNQVRVGDNTLQTNIILNEAFFEEHVSVERYAHIRCRASECMRARDWGETPASNNRPSLDLIYPNTLSSITCTNAAFGRTLPFTRARSLKKAYERLINERVFGAFVPPDQRSEMQRRSAAGQDQGAEAEALD